MFGLFMFGVAGAVLLHVMREHFIGLCVDVSIILLALLLSMSQALDESARLEAGFRHLASQKKMVQEISNRITAWIVRYDHVNILWQYHTAQMLDLFEAVCPIVQFPKGDQFKARQLEPLSVVLNTLSSKLKVVMHGMG